MANVSQRRFSAGVSAHFKQNPAEPGQWRTQQNIQASVGRWRENGKRKELMLWLNEIFTWKNRVIYVIVKVSFMVWRAHGLLVPLVPFQSLLDVAALNTMATAYGDKLERVLSHGTALSPSGLLSRLRGIYSCFEKGCPAKPNATMPRGIMGNGGFMVLDWSVSYFSDIAGNSTNKCIYTFSFLVGKHREPQSINTKFFLPIIPIGIVAYAFTLLWDNLCRNSCIHVLFSFMPIDWLIN